jgi:hypothetical protein
MAQVVNRCPFTAKARFRFPVSPFKKRDGRSGTGTVFFFTPSTSVFPCQCNTLSEIRQHLIEKYFHLVCNGLISTPECEWLALRPGCFIASNQRLGADAARHLQQLPQQFRR